jgi:hypothetical protein
MPWRPWLVVSPVGRLLLFGLSVGGKSNATCHRVGYPDAVTCNMKRLQRVHCIHDIARWQHSWCWWGELCSEHEGTIGVAG